MKKLVLFHTIIFLATIVFTLSVSAQGMKAQKMGSHTFNKAHIYIVHGYMASPKDHWFPWLKQKLEKEGAVVHILDLPESSNPNSQLWDDYINQHVSSLDENTYFIAHSLGCISTLRYLSRVNNDKKIGGIVLVSGFSNALPNLPQLDNFTRKSPAFGNIVKISPNRKVILSLSDKIVSPSFTEKLAVLLKVTPIRLSNGGHFLSSDGFTKFPTVYESLKSFLN